MRSTTWERGGELEPEPSPLNLWGSTTFPLCRISARPSATSSRATRRVTSISGLQSRGRTLRGISEGQLLRRVSRRYRPSARGEQRCAWLWDLLLFFFFSWTDQVFDGPLARRMDTIVSLNLSSTATPAFSQAFRRPMIATRSTLMDHVARQDRGQDLLRRTALEGIEERGGGGCCPRERDHATDGFRVSAGRRVLQWAAAEAARATRGDAARR